MYSYTNPPLRPSGPDPDHLRIVAAAVHAKSQGTDQLWIYLEFGKLLFFPSETQRLSSGFVCTFLVDSILRGLDEEVWNQIDSTLELLRTDHHSN